MFTIHKTKDQKNLVRKEGKSNNNELKRQEAKMIGGIGGRTKAEES